MNLTYYRYFGLSESIVTQCQIKHVVDFCERQVWK
jgi:hypothetical protein